MDPATLSAIATLAATGFGALTGGKNKVPAEQRALMNAQRGLTDSQTRGSDIENAMNTLGLLRKRAQDPLWRAVQMMASSRLPLFAQQGFDFSSMMNPINDAATHIGPASSLPDGFRTRPAGSAPNGIAVQRGGV